MRELVTLILAQVYLRRVDTFDFMRVSYQPSLRCRTCAATIRVLVGCYHPSRQNTNTGKLTPPMMDAVFRTAKRYLR